MEATPELSSHTTQLSSPFSTASSSASGPAPAQCANCGAWLSTVDDVSGHIGVCLNSCLTNENIELLVMHEEPDITFLVGPRGNQKRFQIASAVVKMYSPVWKTMLDKNKGWAESTMSEISFPEDDPTSFHIILAIFHAKFALLPKTVDLDDLLNLADRVDKYALVVNAIKPHLSTWIAQLRTAKDDAAYWPLIAWTFGLRDVFQEKAQELVLTVSSTDGNNWTSASGLALSHLPNRVIGK
jgi:hypothetical protein